MRYTPELTIGYRSNGMFNMSERIRQTLAKRYPGCSDEQLTREFISALINANVDFEILTVSEIPLRSDNRGTSERRLFASTKTDGQDD